MPAQRGFVMQGPDHSSLLILLITSNEGIRYMGLEAEEILCLHRGRDLNAMCSGEFSVLLH